ncbi:MAG: bifunctional riboflavin kinase/FAD synthetase [Vampirovibrionales bacterium]|nr:bifunctional riboflavin kinase/FAD synthetase [Vampirovibrionales bacterium]
MRLIETLTGPSLAPSSCAMGMFDGVHTGHRMVLENALREARANGWMSVAFSFANHPQALLSATPTQLLSSREERLEAFAAMGFDAAVILPFDEAMRAIEAPVFVQRILRGFLNVRSVSVGYDYRFGAGRRGDCDYLRQCAAREGFQAQIVDPVRAPDADGHAIVSSTLIRKLLNFGDVKQANSLLGQPYALTGRVTAGVQRGRQLGFPTANLDVAPQRLIPAIGAYAAQARVCGKTYRAVCNIGHAPTFEDAFPRRVEAHLLDYDGPSFYDETMRIAFLARLRDERAFPSADALVEQIRRDCASARALTDDASVVAHPEHA